MTFGCLMTRFKNKMTRGSLSGLRFRRMLLGIEPIHPGHHIAATSGLYSGYCSRNYPVMFSWSKHPSFEKAECFEQRTPNPKLPCYTLVR